MSKMKNLFLSLAVLASVPLLMGAVNKVLGTQYFTVSNFYSWANGGTAGTTQTQAGATQLTGREYYTLSTVANTSDGYKLEKATKGAHVVIKNDGANTAKIYPDIGGSIDGGTVTSGSVSLPAGSTLELWGNSTTDNWSSSAQLCVAGNSAASFTTIAASSTLAVTGATTLSSTLGVTGAATLSSTLGVTGLSTLTGGATLGGPLKVTAMTPPTAATTQTQAGAHSGCALTGNAAVITVGNANDGCELPAEAAGRIYMACNSSATNAMKLYCVGSCKVNTVTATTGVVVSAATCVTCLSNGTDEFCTHI